MLKIHRRSKGTLDYIVNRAIFIQAASFHLSDANVLNTPVFFIATQKPKEKEAESLSSFFLSLIMLALTTLQKKVWRH